MRFGARHSGISVCVIDSALVMRASSNAILRLSLAVTKNPLIRRKTAPVVVAEGQAPDSMMISNSSYRVSYICWRSRRGRRCGVEG